MIKGGSERILGASSDKFQERQTRQRREIQLAFAREERPLAPREVHGLVKAALPGLGLATVYRAVKRLVAEGQLVALEIPGLGVCYEMPGIHPHHAHFLCRSCKRVFELEKEEKKPHPDLPAGFAFEDYELILKGTCAECGDE
jgi:Fur family transcriptional regulator, ferric uptake regulator